MNFKNINRYLFIFSALLLASCMSSEPTDKKMLLQVSKMDNEPITRLSFVPTKNKYDDIEIILYQDDENKSDK